MSRTWERARYLTRMLGWKSASARGIAKFFSFVYRHEVAYVAISFQDDLETSKDIVGRVDEYGTGTALVETPAALDGYEAAMLPEIPYSKLRRFLEGDSKRIVILAIRPDEKSDGRKVIGYGRFERGIFTVWKGRIERPMPDDFLWFHDNFVAPAYRGQRVHLFIRLAIYDYCRAHGITRSCGTIQAHNVSSIRAYRNRSNSANRLLGPIEHVRILGGLYRWSTPWPKIEPWLMPPADAGCP